MNNQELQTKVDEYESVFRDWGKQMKIKDLLDELENIASVYTSSTDED